MLRRSSLSLLLFASCASAPEEPRQAYAGPEPAAPLVLEGSAYETAGRLELPAVAPGNYEGLHNVFQLSDAIVSGGEPQDEAALEQLAAWGVRTILSVDGKAPDAETAAALGLRYVHVPIQYSGITDDEVTKLAKTFRELEGPFYVHCFHGKHRGPAAAAVGRIVVDGVSREQAMAEMRQWCSTSPKYEGLYAAVATIPMPSAARTAASDFDFEPAHTFVGLRAAMIPLPRHWDQLTAAAARGWTLDPDHPDIVPAREAEQVREILDACAELPAVRTHPDDFHGWLDDARHGAGDLALALAAGTAEASPDAAWREAAASAFQQVSRSCSSCHDEYRNH